ncbi:creatinine amidohydrolase [Amphritea atlantica]|uniref:Creatinine amidohydrolase n=1 Tax=Amphritea atlantica TaxID=355243 RepID=A0A1H9CVJ7_9GAMM|nr:creatininase [Amphritea atlantica]SEQ05242.1 creatinine amidohydrolase [Amphritea atlantica]
MVKLADLDWKTYESRVANGEAVILLPIGAIEQHGPHMSMNPDVLIPEAISCSVAEQLVNALVAHPISYGYKSQVKSGGGNFFPGTTCIDGKTLIDMIRDVVVAYARHGNRKFVLVNGHYENSMFIVEGIDLALERLRHDGIDANVMLLSYWDYVNQDTIEQVFPDGFTGWDVEHGGVLETSLMLHLHPELVNMDKVIDQAPATFPPYDIFPSDRGWVPSHGTLSSARKATAESGKLLMDVCVKGISSSIQMQFSD